MATRFGVRILYAGLRFLVATTKVYLVLSIGNILDPYVAVIASICIALGLFVVYLLWERLTQDEIDDRNGAQVDLEAQVQEHVTDKLGAGYFKGVSTLLNGGIGIKLGGRMGAKCILCFI